jgi:precorrin-2 dehydrogenase/sirohydrochlorin ferrochelatase
VETLLACGAHVTVVSPLPPIAARAWPQKERSPSRCGPVPQRIWGKCFSSSGRRTRGAQPRISAEAERADPLQHRGPAEVCNFILPSILQRGDLTITVSTSGKSPAFAKKLRRTLAAQYGQEYAAFLDLMGAIRQRLLAQAHAPEAHKPLFEALIDSDLPALIRANQRDAINVLLEKVLGKGYRVEELLKAD